MMGTTTTLISCVKMHVSGIFLWGNIDFEVAIFSAWVVRFVDNAI